MARNTEETFWSRVKKTDYCWNWTGTLHNGYGNFSLNGKGMNAHRASYLINKGEIPKGLHIDHLCRNTACVNPEHLEAVTMKENNNRGIRGRLKTQCGYGHPWVKENIYAKPNGHRECRECRKKWHFYRPKKHHFHQGQTWGCESVDKRLIGLESEVERLKASREHGAEACHQAWNRIREVEAERDRYKNALEKIVSDEFYMETCGDSCVEKAQEIAKEALKHPEV